jgi:hypothetical protein
VDGDLALRHGAEKAKLLRLNRGARRVLAIAKVRDGAGNRGSSSKSMRMVP